MHAVIVGAGAIGLLYGGWLRAGVDTSFVARGDALRALRDNGLTIESDSCAVHVGEIRATGSIADLPPADVLIFTVKLYDLDVAAHENAPGLAPGGLVIGLQNGISAFDLLAHTFPPDQIMTGPVFSAARVSAPGVVEYSGARHRLVIGNPSGAVHPLAPALTEAWRHAGVDAEISASIATVLWTKYLGFATNAALTCLARQPAGVLYTDPDLVTIAERSIGEIMAIAAAEGVPLPEDASDATLRLLRSFPFDMVASMRHDLDAGRRLELDAIIGTIVEKGRAYGIATPFHETAFACLKPFRDGAPEPRMEQE